MFKDISIGQFFPGESFIHKLDPRVKLFCDDFIHRFDFSSTPMPMYLPVVAYLLLIVSVAKIPPMYVIRSETADSDSRDHFYHQLGVDAGNGDISGFSAIYKKACARRSSWPFV